jgi:hypothetical protein
MTKTLLKNMPSLSDLATDPDAAKGVELDAIQILLADAVAQATLAAQAKKVLIGEIESRYGANISAAYLREGKDAGTVHVTADGYELTADRPKKVEWDQAELQAIAARITAAGDHPSEYMDVTFTMQERRYTALPRSMQEIFAPARTVKPGSLSIKLAKVA